jgi:hypothetical protein
LRIKEQETRLTLQEHDDDDDYDDDDDDNLWIYVKEVQMWLKWTMTEKSVKIDKDAGKRWNSYDNKKLVIV